MVVDILSNRYNRMPTFPMYSNLDFPDRNVFLKSGTSRKFSDNRVIGFTDNYIIGVRVGNKDGSNMKGVSGVS
jgi:penicillin-binding protein 1C